ELVIVLTSAVSMVGLTLLHRRGYFRQHLDPDGMQTESPSAWNPEEKLEPLSTEVSITLEGRCVRIRTWRYQVEGVTGHTIPVYFLDTDVEGNDPWDRTLTGQLYGGDDRYRLCQEAVLGIGGVAVLQARGHVGDLQHHMNEGHSALLTLALLSRRLRDRGLGEADESDVEAVRAHCIFTTHTPVPAGHDKFPLDLVRKVLGDERTDTLERLGCLDDSTLNMTYLALRFSRYINGVAMQHGEVSRDMFPRFPITAITNGVHAVTWTSPPFQQLFDRHISAWRRDNVYLRYALKIPLEEIRATHLEAKRVLLDEINKRNGVHLEESVFTIGYARRATLYKRADLIFQDKERLRGIVSNVGALQIVFAGKAHPHDDPGKEMIHRIFEAAEHLDAELKVVYLEDYDMDLAKRIIPGVDMWLNTPRRPQEASGTSGMKAALNGVPSLSVLDGWWIEGHQEGVTGWAFGDCAGCDADTPGEIESLYNRLEKVIIPLFYQQPNDYAKVMRNAIALNGSFFNTQRMVLQYLTNAYFPANQPPSPKLEEPVPSPK
ncbi:MAG: alpha-glucan family phosphorylase, partial [Candidatus Krumholzibacteriia bacterium]